MSFFASKWVDRPEHVTELGPTALPAGFVAGGVAAGIKPEGEDVGLLFSEREATTSAARFTTNALLAAPVIVAREADLGALRAVTVNSGNANVSDGQRGLDTARAQQRAAAEALDLDPAAVAVASTGVIARELPRDKAVAGIRQAAGALAPNAQAFSESILTTDQGPKRACLELKLPSGGSVRLAGQAKGGGMISPHFATMLCFVQTDAALQPETVELLTGVCVKRSFDRISVDGQLSTNDAVFVMANGASGVAVAPESPDELALGEAMDALLRQLALEIVSDGEGASRVGRVVVHGDVDTVGPVARAVANSPLVKTALAGADPNFGRILQAVGQGLAGRAPFDIHMAVDGLCVVAGGAMVELDYPDEWARIEGSFAADELDFEIRVPGRGGEAEVFFSDLTHEYVSINADYTT